MSQRRSFGGPRREASERVVIRVADTSAIAAGLAGVASSRPASARPASARPASARPASARVAGSAPATPGPATTPGSNGADAADAELPRLSAEIAEAWTLNVSRGGCRVVLETPVTVGADYEVQVGEAAFRPARVVWVRDEADGQIAGLQFLDVEAGEVPTSSYPPTS